MKIKSNEELFNRFRALETRLNMLAAIVQNDMDLDEDQIQEWKISSYGVSKDLEILLYDVESSIFL